MARLSTRRRKVIPKVQAQDEGVLSTEFVLPGWKLRLVHAAIIVAAGLWIYGPALHGDWLWDDDVYIYKNPLMHDPARLWKAWFQPGSFMEYYPIGQTVQYAQWSLWHNDTFGYHLTNVILHIVGALVLWRLFAKLRLPLAWLGGLIFVVHPMNVESVAWIVELKNTLSLPPFLLAMCFYLDYDERRQPRDYFLSLGLFLVAMLCKISMAPFPAVILLYAWWKRGRIGLADCVATAPFVLVSLVLFGIASHAAKVFAQGVQFGSNDLLPVGDSVARMALAGLAFAFYFSNVFLPLKLLPIYPVWSVEPVFPVLFLPWIVSAALAGFLWWKRKTWGRHVLLGLGFFAVMLVPFLAFGVAFHPRDSWVMNHFLYIPMIGLIGLVVAALGQVDSQLSRETRIGLTAGVTVAVALLAFQSHAYAAAFTNSETQWGYTLERNPGAWTAHIGLGSSLLLANQLEDAESHFEAALRLRPDSSAASADLGVTLAQMGRPEEGIAELRKSLIFNPNDATTMNNLGVILAQLGRFSEARPEFEQAMKVQPNFADPYNNLGNVHSKLNEVDAAGECYRQALKVKPDFAQAHFNLGNVLGQLGRTAEAQAQYEEALRINPDYIDARINLGAALVAAGRPADAAQQFAQVLQIDPDNQTVRQNLAKLQQAAAQK